MDARRGQNVPTDDYECLNVERAELLEIRGAEHDSPCFFENAQKGTRPILVLFVGVRIPPG
jgi:hypothetical protein